MQCGGSSTAGWHRRSCCTNCPANPLNQLDAAAPVLKGPVTASLIDPRWSTEGTNVADLIKYMTKLKILFGPAAKGNEDVYLALHRGLATYLVILNENQKAPAKK